MIRRLKLYAELIRIEHTLFSLPFAYVGAIMAAQGLPSLEKLFYITLAVFGARSVGMSWNRLVDKRIDLKNERTADRVLPAQRLTTGEVIVWTIFSTLLLILASWQLDPLCFTLFPVAITVILFYSLTKRFTWLCHLFLGITLGLAPVGSWIGIRGSVSIQPIILGLGVAFWTAGFDIIYSTLDKDFDKKEGLQSVPVKFGLSRALRISLIFHFIAFILFSTVKFVANLGMFYIIALWIVGFLLYLENKVVSPKDLSRVNLAFFKINSLVSITILLFVLMEFTL